MMRLRHTWLELLYAEAAALGELLTTVWRWIASVYARRHPHP